MDNIASRSMELQVNCGFARVAIRKYTTLQRGKKFTHNDKKDRAQKFRELFSCSCYGIDGSIFESEKGRDSKFDRLCKKVNTIFNKWSRQDQRLNYLATFSPER